MKRVAAEVAKLSKDELRNLIGPDERPTLKSIARISGLATTTVSQAMRNGSNIGSDTKELVARIADAIGYVPNRAGLRLRTGQTNVITLVVPGEGDRLNALSELTSSIAKELRGTSFHLNVLPWFPDEDPLRPIKYVVETRSADAVIFNMIEPADERVEYLLKEKFPFVCHGRTKWADQHAYYDYDNTEFVRVAISRLAERGRKSILAILPPRNQNYAQDMMRGLEQASEQNGVQYRVSENVDSDQSPDEIRHWVTRRLKQSPEIDAVLCTSPKAAISAIVAIEQNGRILGKDIDVYSKEVIPILKMLRENIIVVKEDVNLAGQFLARAAIQQLQHPELPLMQHLEVPTDLPE
jgi:LacI family transcriptional regulator